MYSRLGLSFIGLEWEVLQKKHNQECFEGFHRPGGP